MSMFTLTAMWSIGQTPCSFELAEVWTLDTFVYSCTHMMHNGFFSHFVDSGVKAILMNFIWKAYTESSNYCHVQCFVSHCWTGAQYWKLSTCSQFRALQCWYSAYNALHCGWNNFVCCLDYASAWSIEYGDYSQWHQHSIGSDRLSYATCGFTGNVEPVTVNYWISCVNNAYAQPANSCLDWLFSYHNQIDIRNCYQYPPPPLPIISQHHWTRIRL